MVAPATVEVGTLTQTWTRSEDLKPSRDFKVVLPVARSSDAAVQATLDATLSVRSVLGESRASVQEIGWTDEVLTEVAWHSHGLADFRVEVQGSSAYPTTLVHHMLIDLLTGERITESTFSNPEGLVRHLADAMAPRLAAADPRVSGMLRRPDSSDLSRLQINAESLIIEVDHGLPHAAAALAPNGLVTIPWSTAVAWLAHDSPLRRAAAHAETQ